MRELMLKEKEELHQKGLLFRSEIEGVSDLIWSTALSSVSGDKEIVKKWFYDKIPFLNDKIPVDVIRNENNGDEIIFDLLLRIRYGVPG